MTANNAALASTRGSAKADLSDEEARRERIERFLEMCVQGNQWTRARIDSLALTTQRWVQRFGAFSHEFDLFEVLGIAGKENRYTDFLAWLCKRDAQQGLTFVSHLLSQVHLGDRPELRMGQLLNVRRELATDDGRIDLVLEFEQRAIALEAKVWSSEHATPGAQPQTVSYRSALERRLMEAGRPKSVLVILLSPAGTPALGEAAGTLSFVALAHAVLQSIPPQATSETQAVLRLFAAHVLNVASQAIAGHSFWDIHRAIRLPHNAQPDWVTRDAHALAQLSIALEAMSP